MNRGRSPVPRALALCRRVYKSVDLQGTIRPLEEDIREHRSCGTDFAEDFWIGRGHCAFLRGDPCSHAVCSGIHCSEGGTAKRVMDQGGRERVTRADSVCNFDGKSWVLMVRLRGDQCAARGAASDANKTNSELAAEPTGGENVGTLGTL